MAKRFVLPLLGASLLVTFLTVMELSAKEEFPSGNSRDKSPINPYPTTLRVYLGPIAGFNQNFHTSGFESFAQDAHCPDFSNGMATGLYFGASMELFFGDPENTRSSLVFRLLHDDRPASFAVNDVDYPQRVFPEGGGDEILYPKIRHEAELRYSLLSFDAQYKVMLGNTRVGLALGPSLGYAYNVHLEQTMNLVEPLNATFENTGNHEMRNSGRTVVLHDSEVPDREQFRVGMKIGLVYEITLHKMLVVPHVSYDYALTKLTARENLRVNAFQTGVDIRFAL